MKQRTKNTRRRKPVAEPIPVTLTIGDHVYRLVPRDGQLALNGERTSVIVMHDDGVPGGDILFTQHTPDNWLGWAVGQAINKATGEIIGGKKKIANSGCL